MYYNYGNKGRVYNLDNFKVIDVNDAKINIAKDYLVELNL
jgi:hypothetical protein